jgi:hypothetical protein
MATDPAKGPAQEIADGAVVSGCPEVVLLPRLGLGIPLVGGLAELLAPRVRQDVTVPL